MAAGNIQEIPHDAEDLEFEVIEEGWNKYELESGIYLLARTVLIKVFHIKGPNLGQTQLGPATHDIFISKTRGEKGPPSPLMPEEISGQIKVERRQLRINKSDEVWNKYKLTKTGERIRTRVTITDVFLVPKRFDVFGYPAVIIESGVMIYREPKNI